MNDNPIIEDCLCVVIIGFNLTESGNLTLKKENIFFLTYCVYECVLHCLEFRGGGGNL